MEGTEGSDDGYCWISGCPLHILGREPPSPRTPCLCELVGDGKNNVFA
jgi:hypothetical protein